MAIEPCGSLLIFPPLTDSQTDSQIQRLESALGDVADCCLRHVARALSAAEDAPAAAGIADALTVEVFGLVLFALYPEDFAGDGDAALAEAVAFRDRVPDRPITVVLLKGGAK